MKTLSKKKAIQKLWKAVDSIMDLSDIPGIDNHKIIASEKSFVSYLNEILYKLENAD